MIREEAERIVRRMADQHLFERDYAHPELNHPRIKIKVVKRYGPSYLVSSSLLPYENSGGGSVYRSEVRTGQRLDTRIQTAFRRAAELGSSQHWRRLATAEYNARPAYVFDLGIKAFVRRQLHPAPSDYALNYSYNWTEPISKVIIEGYRLIEEWRVGLGEPWSEELVRRWVATLDG